jgi:hypothetical protein
VGSANAEQRKVRLLAFIDARLVAARLDEVLGFLGWSNEYRKGPEGGVLCRITVHVEGWPAHALPFKEDGAENTDIEAVKGGLSDAFKRCAVKLGVGAYLYDVDAPWADVAEGRMAGGIYVHDKKSGLKGYVRTPDLPAWALPAKRKEPEPAADEGADPSWTRECVVWDRELERLKLKPRWVAAWLEGLGKPTMYAMTSAVRARALKELAKTEVLEELYRMNEGG